MHASRSVDRRQFIRTTGTTAAVAATALTTATSSCTAAQPVAGFGITAESASAARPRFCLNTSTIRGQKLSLPATIDLVATAGYDSIEVWIRELDQHVQSGGTLADIRKQCEDRGLRIESAIGFPNWIVDDPEKRTKGLDEAKRCMELVQAVGGHGIAAPPVGATRKPGLDLFAAAERYQALLQLGHQVGIKPHLELWGFSQNLSRLGELLFVLIEAGDASATIIPDIYHIYKGGSDFAGLAHVNPQSIELFHINDYPDLPRETIGDADRVYPGDGVAPLTSVLSDLLSRGFNGALSLELFNRSYWEQDAAQVAATGLSKMRDAVAQARQ